jgi:lipopolysaccharide/colanic/teichoic acid biosynthesis glycosyltransferase
MLDSSALQLSPCRKGSSISCKNCLEAPPASSWTRSRTRRVIDVLVASISLLLFAVPMAIVAVCVRLTSEGRALFIQERMGRRGQLFRIYKFRSMFQRPEGVSGPPITCGGDRRITPIGRFLRASKLDELPQFYNVLCGDMSLIGPRPKLPQYDTLHNTPYRPGITGMATIVFRHEEEMLRSIDPQKMHSFYTERIKPLKAQLDACYMCRATFASDLRVLIATMASCLIPRRAPALITPAVTSLNTTGYRILEQPPETSTAGD